MSDEAAKHFETQQPQGIPEAAGRSVSLSITLHPNGQIEFALPSNKILAHGLLGVAQEQLAKLATLSDLERTKAQTRAGDGLAGLMRRMGKGG